jgi:hypothetical protein
MLLYSCDSDKLRGAVPIFAFDTKLSIYLKPRQCFVHDLISLLSLVFHYCFKQQYPTISRDKPDTGDATDADINERQVLCRQSRKIIYSVNTF